MPSNAIDFQLDQLLAPYHQQGQLQLFVAMDVLGPKDVVSNLDHSHARAFHGFRFPAEVILWAVRWYLQFPISYRDLERMLADRGVKVDPARSRNSSGTATSSTPPATLTTHRFKDFWQRED